MTVKPVKPHDWWWAPVRAVASKLSAARKAVVAVAGVAAQLVALGVLSGSTLHYVQVGLAVLTAAGVYAAPNKAKAAPVK